MIECKFVEFLTYVFFFITFKDFSSDKKNSLLEDLHVYEQNNIDRTLTEHPGPISGLKRRQAWNAGLLSIEYSKAGKAAPGNRNGADPEL